MLHLQHNHPCHWIFKTQSSLTQIKKKKKDLITTPSHWIAPDVGLIEQILSVMITAKHIVAMVITDTGTDHQPA